jgi:hypothetical protein
MHAELWLRTRLDRRHQQNRGFEQWGEILGDAMVAAALIDRLVHHATMITLKGKSYRLRERGLEVTPTSDAAGALFDARIWCTFRCPLTFPLAGRRVGHSRQ